MYCNDKKLRESYYVPPLNINSTAKSPVTIDNETQKKSTSEMCYTIILNALNIGTEGLVVRLPQPRWPYYT